MHKKKKEIFELCTQRCDAKYHRIICTEMIENDLQTNEQRNVVFYRPDNNKIYYVSCEVIPHDHIVQDLNEKEIGEQRYRIFKTKPRDRVFKNFPDSLSS